MILLCKKFKKKDAWQTDQEFLKNVIYPIVKNNVMVHDEFFKYKEKRKNFPTLRFKKEFVGQAFNENDEPLHPEHMNAERGRLLRPVI